MLSTEAVDPLPLPCGVAPFLSTPTAEVFLLPVDHEPSEMDSLVRLGVLTSYRYLDASPQPAILGIRARS